MDQNEAKVKFRQSDELYQLGQYQDSLRVLHELNEAFPNTKNILFPIARNLFALGQHNEALNICDKLIVSFNYPKAVELKQKIQQGQVGSSSAFPTSGVPGLDNDDSIGEGEIQGVHLSDIDIDDVGGVHLSDIGLEGVDTSGIESLLDTPATAANTAPIPRNTGPDMGKWVLAGVIFVGLMLVVGAIIGVASVLGSESTADGVLAGAGGVILAIFYLAAFFIGWAATTTIGYITLLILGALPEHGLLDNFINIGKVALLITLVSIIPLVGGIVGIIIFVSKYEIGISGCLLYLLVSLGFGLLIGGLFFMLLLALGAGLSTLDAGTPALLISCVPRFGLAGV